MGHHCVLLEPRFGGVHFVFPQSSRIEMTRPPTEAAPNYKPRFYYLSYFFLPVSPWPPPPPTGAPPKWGLPLTAGPCPNPPGVAIELPVGPPLPPTCCPT